MVREPRPACAGAPLAPQFALTVMGRWVGSLTWCSSDGARRSIILQPRLTKLLLVMQRAWHDDAEVEPALRGWRTNQEMVKTYAGFEPMATWPEPASLAHYRAEITRCLATAARAHQEPPPLLFESWRNAGVRLVHSLTVADRNSKPLYP